MTAASDPEYLAVEYVRLDSLRPEPTNPKGHDIASIRASIEYRGLVEVAAVLDERTGKMIAGHGRRLALLGMVEDGLSPPKRVRLDDDGGWLVPVGRGYRSKNAKDARSTLVAVNQTTIAGGWDTAPLLASLDGLPTAALLSTGFSVDAVDDLRARLQEDAADDPDARGKRNGSGATGTEPSMGERLRDYRGRTVRSVVLDYPLDTFEWLVEHVPAAREALDVDSNADLFLALVADRLGIDRPPPSDAVVPE